MNVALVSTTANLRVREASYHSLTMVLQDKFPSVVYVLFYLCVYDLKLESSDPPTSTTRHQYYYLSYCCLLPHSCSLPVGKVKCIRKLS